MVWVRERTIPTERSRLLLQHKIMQATSRSHPKSWKWDCSLHMPMDWIPESLIKLYEGHLNHWTIYLVRTFALSRDAKSCIIFVTPELWNGHFIAQNMASFSMWSLGFNLGWVRVRFVVDEVELQQVFNFPLLVIIPPFLRTHLLPHIIVSSVLQFGAFNRPRGRAISRGTTLQTRRSLVLAAAQWPWVRLSL
jgi:hypothetical protein